jgi:undecaprenyl diphosphate synthase
LAIQHPPQHIAIIMDGNRRWAKQQGITTARGHFLGIRNIIHIIDSALAARVPILSLYAFSTENWNRAKKEVSVLMT